MPKRSSPRLAGCIAIELLLGFLTAAADFDYQAGAAASGQARALVLEDRHRHPAVIVNAAFSAPQDAVDAMGAALSALDPARVHYAQGSLAVSTDLGCTAVSGDGFDT